MKMTKIASGAAAAALAVFALAADTFAAGAYAVSPTIEKAAYYTVTLYSEQEGRDISGLTIAESLGSADGSKSKFSLDVALDTAKPMDEITFNGSVNVYHTFTAKMTDGSGISDSVHFSGETKINNLKVAEVHGAREIGEMSVSGGSLISQDAVYDSGSRKATAEATLTFSLYPEDFKELIGSSYFTDGSIDQMFDENGLVKYRTEYYNALENGRIATKSGKIIVSQTGSNLGGFDRPIVFGENEGWTVKSISVSTVKESVPLSKTPYDFKFWDNFYFDNLYDMYDGASVTLKFERPSDAGSVFNAAVGFVDDVHSVYVNKNCIVNDNTLTLDMPAEFCSVLNYFNGRPLIRISTDDEANRSKTKLVSVIITPKDGAGAAETTAAPKPAVTTAQTNAPKPAVTTAAPKPGNNGGSTNNNNNSKPSSGGDRNQPTGAALAIVPAVLAAAGVIISKKRK